GCVGKVIGWHEPMFIRPGSDCKPMRARGISPRKGTKEQKRKSVERAGWQGHRAGIETPKTKLQTPKKSQVPNSKPRTALGAWRCLVFGVWCLVFGVWCLVWVFNRQVSPRQDRARRVISSRLYVGSLPFLLLGRDC